jgi:hypothetical protein
MPRRYFFDYFRYGRYADNERNSLEEIMEEAEFERMRQQFDEKIRERFSGAPIEQVEVLKYGDDPEIEPGQYIVQVVVAASGDPEERMRAFEAFHEANRERFHELRRDLDKLPLPVILQFVAAGEPADGKRRVLRLGGRPKGAEGPGLSLTPVMARVAAEDLETLDTLIAAGIATSRAEAVRWALARIRERPAYEQLRARTREIEELKSQF